MIYEVAGGLVAARTCPRPSREDRRIRLRVRTDIPGGLVGGRRGIFSQNRSQVRCEVYEETGLPLGGLVDGGLGLCAAWFRGVRCTSEGSKQEFHWSAGA